MSIPLFVLSTRLDHDNVAIISMLFSQIVVQVNHQRSKSTIRCPSSFQTTFHTELAAYTLTPHGLWLLPLTIQLPLGSLSTQIVTFYSTPLEMYATSVSSSEGFSMSDKLKSMAQKPKPEIKITLKGADSSSTIMTYSTLDKIQGQVIITSPYRARLENLNINLVGS